MIDVGKIADLVLLMVDASFGFEMVRALILLLGAPDLRILRDRKLSSS